MDNLGKQHVWPSEKNATQVPCLLKRSMEVFHGPHAIIAPLLVATPTGWLWFWILKAQRSWQKSLFSEDNSPLAHVHKLIALPEAPWWIWGSQKHVQWCWLRAVLERGDSQFLCLQLLSGRVRGSIWHPHWVSSVLVKVLESSSALSCLWHHIGLIMESSSAMTRCFPMALYSISPGQAHGKGPPHSQKLWVYQELYNNLQNSITRETPT